MLKQLSPRYPGLKIHVTVDTQPGAKLQGPRAFTVRNGAYLQRN